MSCRLCNSTLRHNFPVSFWDFTCSLSTTLPPFLVRILPITLEILGNFPAFRAISAGLQLLESLVCSTNPKLVVFLLLLSLLLYWFLLGEATVNIEGKYHVTFICSDFVKCTAPLDIHCYTAYLKYSRTHSQQSCLLKENKIIS